MQTQYFIQNNLNPLVKPVHELMELNVKTIQKLSYLSPVELLNVHKPEEILQKNINSIIKNTQFMLDYVHDVFHIFEKNMFNTTDSVVEYAKVPVKQTIKVAQPKTSKAVKRTKSTVRSGVSPLKDTKKTLSTKAKSPVKKSASSRTVSKTKISGKSTVHQVHKSGVTKQASKKPLSSLKEVVKNSATESGLNKPSPTNIKPMIQLSTDIKKDTLK